MRKKKPSEDDKRQEYAFELEKFATFYSVSFPFLAVLLLHVIHLLELSQVCGFLNIFPSAIEFR